MPDLLEEYKAYYATRAEKFAGNSNYKLSYEAEKNLSAAMQGCNELGEFKDRLGNLNELCAVALVKDEAMMERDFFKKHKEDVRIKASLEILEHADEYQNVMDLITMVNKVMNKNMLEITADEAQRQLFYDWDLVDRVEMYTKAVVPEKYKKDMLDSAESFRKSIRDNANHLKEEIRKFVPDWDFNPDIIMAHRHRRLCPFKDEHILEQLSKYKSIL